jgi:hypothetical protein
MFTMSIIFDEWLDNETDHTPLQNGEYRETSEQFINSNDNLQTLLTEGTKLLSGLVHPTDRRETVIVIRDKENRICGVGYWNEKETLRVLTAGGVFTR